MGKIGEKTWIELSSKGVETYAYLVKQKINWGTCSNLSVTYYYACKSDVLTS